MVPDENGAVTLWDENGLWVGAELRDDGALLLSGQHLRVRPDGEVSEYEYSLTVAARDVPKVVAALGGRPFEHPLVVLARHGEAIVRRGERKWLRSIRVRAEFWCRHG